MANIIRHPGWYLPESSVTPESVALNRRSFLQQLGFTGGGLLATSLLGCSKSPVESTSAEPESGATSGSMAKGFPVSRNPEFNPGWRLTEEKIAGKYNNFYEFTTEKDRVHKLVWK